MSTLQESFWKRKTQLRKYPHLIGLCVDKPVAFCVMMIDVGGAQLTVSGATRVLVSLGAIRKQAEQITGTKPRSGTPHGF